MNDSFSSTSNEIGGVFRDRLRTILLHFAKQLEAESAVHAKVLAIRDGLLIAVASRWSNTWLSKLNQIQPMQFCGSWNLLLRNGSSKIPFVRYYSTLAGHIEWSISYIRRTRNETTDVLTRVGASGSNFIDFT